MRHVVFILWCMTVSVFFAAAAQAQTGLLGVGVEDEAAPAEELPTLPVVEEEAAANEQGAAANGGAMDFPQLPPSRLCGKRDILGMWKMVMVFQAPPGVELEDFGSYPYQYALFNNNDTFRTYKASDESVPAEIIKVMQDPNNKVLEQFVIAAVSDASVLYLYKDSAVVNSMACFIVANPSPPFAEGQMLLMPPPERANVRMVKVYQKVYSAPQGNQKKNKKNRKKRQQQ